MFVEKLFKYSITKIQKKIENVSEYNKVESVNPKMQQKTKEHQKREIVRTVFHVGHA